MKTQRAGVFKWVAGILVASASFASAQTYINTNTATGNWSAGTWSPGVPVGSSTTVLTFSGVLAAGSTLTNDLGTFDLTTLNISTTTSALTIGGNQLNFTGASNTINFNSSIQNNSVNAPINFVNTLTINANQFVGSTIGSSGTMTGTGTLIRNGNNGSLVINSNNSYSGGTIINATSTTGFTNTNSFGTGTVRINAGTLHASGGSRTMANAIEIGGNISLINGNDPQNLTLSGAVDLLGEIRTIGTGGNGGATPTIVTLSGAVSNGGITKTGVSTLRLTGTNTYTGGTIINNGTVQFGTDASIPTTGSVLINNGGALVVNLTSGMTDVASWLSSGKISSSSTGVIALKGASSAAVDFSANGGYNLFLGAYGNSAFTGTLTANGTTYRLGGGGYTLTLSNANALTGSNTLLVGPSLSIGSLSTTLAGSQTSSGGTVALSNSNNMTGATTVQSGTLSLTGANGSLAGSDVTVKQGATLNFAPSSASSVTRVKSVTLNGGTFSVTGPNFATTDTIDNDLTLNSGSNTITVTPGATGSNTLAADNLLRTAGQGWALVNGVGLGKDSLSTTNVGRIILGSAPTLVGTTAALSTGINSAAKDTVIVPWLVGAVTATTGGVGTASGTANTFLTYNATTGLRPLNLTDEFTNNTITTGHNTYITGATTAASSDSINSLVFGGTDAAGTLTINSGVTITNTSGALLFTASDTIGGATGALGFGSAEGLVTVNSSKTGTVTADVTGSGGLSKFGAGTLTMTGAKTYTGVTTINAGVLSTNSLADGGSASGVGASGSAATNLVMNGGVLTYTGAAASSDRLFSVGLLGGSLLSSGTGALNLTNSGSMGFNGESGARVLTLGGSGAFTNTLGAVIGDNGGATGIVKFGASSSWILNDANTYTGSTQILGDTNNGGGSIIVSKLANGGVASGIGASSSAASNLVLNRGTLRYTGSGDSTDRLFTIGAAGSGTGIDASGTGALVFTNTGAAEFLSNGLRTFNLSGSNTGNNTMSLLIGDAGEATAASATGLTKTGAGTWVLTNANTYTGNTIIGAGSTSASATGGVLSVSSLANGGTASNIGASDSAASRLVINSGTLRYTGAAGSTDRLFTIGGTSSGASATLEASGTGAISFTNTGSLAYGNNNQTRVLNFDGTNTGANTLAASITNNGSGVVTLNKSGLGTWVLTGTNTNTGTTTINAGSLQLGSGGATGSLSAAGAIVNNGNLTINRNNAVTQGTDFSTAAITGTGSFTQAGSGTTTLNAANTYNGSTTINGGTLLVSSTGTINNTSGITVNTGGTFKYNSSTTYSGGAISNAGGSVGGSGNLGSTVLGGSGSIDPGNSPGILAVGSTDPTGGLDYNFEYTVANAAPTWSNATASGNDVLRLTSGVTPFTAPLDSSNVVSLYLGVSSLTAGDVFTGGFFTDLSTNFLSSITNATGVFYVLGDGNGTNIYNGVGYYTLAQYDSNLEFNLNTVLVGSADFAGGTVSNGYVMELTAVTIPEPSTYAMLGLGLVSLWALRRKKNKA